MSESISSIPLTKPPQMGDRLASNRSLLAFWRCYDLVSDKDNAKYHFALYSPSLRWHGYSWDERYGMPIKISPVAPGIVWVYTSQNYLMRLQIEQNGEARITAERKTENVSSLHARRDNCLVRSNMKIANFTLRHNGLRRTRAKISLPYEAVFMYFLRDGAIALGHYNNLMVLSAHGEILYREKTEYHDYLCCQPFIMHCGKDYLYYTDDPRQGWRRTAVLKAHRERTGKNNSPIFLSVVDDTCCIAIQHGERDFALYRSSEKSPECVECVCEIQARTANNSIVMYNGLICIASEMPIHGVNIPGIPDNNGFVVWNPLANTFHADIPGSVSIQKISAARIPAIHIPAAWEMNTPSKREI